MGLRLWQGLPLAIRTQKAAVLLGDAAALPLQDGIADCAIAFMSLQDIDQMEAVVREVAAVLPLIAGSCSPLPID